MEKQLKSIVGVVFVVIVFYAFVVNFSTIYDLGKDFGQTLHEAFSDSD